MRSAMHQVVYACSVARTDLDTHERNMLGIAYLRCIAPWRMLWIEGNETKKRDDESIPPPVPMVSDRLHIRRTIISLCQSFLILLRSYLRPLSSLSESRIVYHQWEGDYYRYWVEVEDGHVAVAVGEGGGGGGGEKEHSRTCLELQRRSLVAYQEMVDLAQQRPLASVVGVIT